MIIKKLKSHKICREARRSIGKRNKARQVEKSMDIFLTFCYRVVSAHELSCSLHFDNI